MSPRSNPTWFARLGFPALAAWLASSVPRTAGLKGRASRWRARAALSCLAVAGAAATLTASGVSGVATADAGTPPPCSQPSGDQPAPGPTTVTTVGQAYYCILDDYYSGPVLDDRELLAAAFAGLTQELDRLGADQPDATMPALTGSRDSDWAAFATVYSTVISQIPARDVQQAAAATITGMVASLHDNHARWAYPSQQPPSGDAYGLGLTTSPGAPAAQNNPGTALPPLFVTAVAPGSPAARAGIRPGDVITAVNGAPPFTDGQPSPGVFALLSQSYPQHQTLRVTVTSPLTGAARTLTVTPAAYPAPARAVTSKLLPGDIGYVQLPQFSAGAASQVLAAVTSLQRQAALHGLVLDLRGNGGGSPVETAQLLGAFEHGTPWSYNCTVTGQCTASYPDTATPLLHLPLTVLTDRGCASACDAFSSAVKDLNLGTLIGTRTAGAVSGPGTTAFLDDGSALELPAQHEVSANHELINGIGVAPDYYIPLTAKDLATGHDPDLAKALALLGG